MIESRNNSAKKKAYELFKEFYYKLEFVFSKSKEPYSHLKFVVKQCVQISIQQTYKLNLKLGAYLETDVDKEDYVSFWDDVKKELELI